MLEALKEIGSLLLQQKNQAPLDILIQDPDSAGRYKIVWFLEFDQDGRFLNVSQEDFKKESYHLYLYRQGSGSNAPDFSPTSRVTQPSKTLKRIMKWFENHKNLDSRLDKIYEELQRYHVQILEKLEEYNNLSKDGKILSIKIGNAYPYNIKLFQDILLEDFFAKIEEVSHSPGICSVCNESKDKVFTTSAIYRFYTLDKECYIASGFYKNEAWKNFPLCRDCFLAIDYGKKEVEEKLRFQFYGKQYFLIPQIILKNWNTLQEIIDILRYSEKQVDLDKSAVRENIIDDEEILQDILKDADDFISLYLLFLDRNQKAERIELLVEDVLPSRIRTIIAKKQEVATYYRYFYIGELLDFCDTKRIFFEMVDKLFRGGTICLDTMIGLIVKKIQDVAYENEALRKKALQGVKSLEFLEKMELVKTKGYRMNDRFDELFAKIGAGLDSEVKRGIFLLGVLTQRLLDFQQQMRGSMPFMKNLKSLKMNQKDIEGLLPKLINKFVEYESFHRCEKMLAEAATHYLLKESSWRLSIDEINFYFAAGMALSYETTQTICKGASDEE